MIFISEIQISTSSNTKAYKSLWIILYIFKLLTLTPNELKEVIKLCIKKSVNMLFYFHG